jgi:PP-loop superfamily ATP-utilizing enzyme
VTGEDKGQSVMAVTIVSAHAFRRELDQLGVPADEICISPAMMQRLEFEVFVANLLADIEQLLTTQLRLVEALGSCRIDV